MTALPLEPPDSLVEVGTYQVIRLGEQAAVVVPMADFLRLRALEARASVDDLEYAEDVAAMEDWQAREDAGQTKRVGIDEVRLRLLIG